MSLTISTSDIADAVETGLVAALDQLDAEQAVYGLDIREELALHPVIADAFLKAGYGVYREQRYPADRRRRKVSEGERCDFVITPGGQALLQPDLAATLFDPADAMPLCDAFWLEVKIVSQFNSEGPNRNYSAQLLAPVGRDVSKLSKDPGILHAGLMIILFVEDQRVADHDLDIWQQRCLKRGLPIGAPAQRTIRITNRHGNGVAAIALFPVSHL